MTEAPPRTLYARLGGGTGIRAVVDRFGELVLLDPLLQPYFGGTETSRMRRHQTVFLSRVAGGPAGAEGGGLLPTAGPDDLDEEAFDRMTYYLSVALHEHEAASRDIDEVLVAVRRRRVVPG